MTPARIKGPLTNRPKVLIMINHEPAGRQRMAGFGGLIGPKSGTSKALTTAP
jgi:hypothetical protein